MPRRALLTLLGKKLLHTASVAITSPSNSRPHTALPLSPTKKWSPYVFPLTISLSKKTLHATSPTGFLRLHWKLCLNKPRLHILLNTRENTNCTHAMHCYIGTCRELHASRTRIKCIIQKQGDAVKALAVTLLKLLFVFSRSRKTTPWYQIHLSFIAFFKILHW
jgi:hypothetical protein